MPKHLTTWIVLADGSRARILTRHVDPPGFDLVAELGSADAHVPSHLLNSDRPGRTRESANSAHHSIEPRHDPHELQMVAFLDHVAKYLNDAGAANKFDRMILFAAPRALGHLRVVLDKTVQAKLKAAIDKDLTKTPVDELQAHLAGIE